MVMNLLVPTLLSDTRLSCSRHADSAPKLRCRRETSGLPLLISDIQIVILIVVLIFRFTGWGWFTRHNGWLFHEISPVFVVIFLLILLPILTVLLLMSVLRQPRIVQTGPCRCRWFILVITILKPGLIAL